ncbi:hypothetical protein NQZ68_014701 [Dissostichus eleginoides]|nr:hypothetical protein NQZ68_014701 [Dissostichus eleginoides]
MLGECFCRTVRTLGVSEIYSVRKRHDASVIVGIISAPREVHGKKAVSGEDLRGEELREGDSRGFYLDPMSVQ